MSLLSGSTIGDHCEEKMHLLLLISLLFWRPGCSVVWGPNVTSGPEGSSLTVQCHYDLGWEPHYKWWCRGAVWATCKILVKTTGSEQEVKEGRVSIRDNHKKRIFTVTMERLTEDDADFYWCGIERFGTNHTVKVKVSIDPDLEFEPINLEVKNLNGKPSAVIVNCQPPLEANGNITALTSVPMRIKRISRGGDLRAIVLNCQPPLTIGGEKTDPNSASMYLTVISQKGKPRAVIVSCKPPLEASWKIFAPTCAPTDFTLIYQESMPHTLTVNCQHPKDVNKNITALTSAPTDFTVFTHTPEVRSHSVIVTSQPPLETNGRTTASTYAPKDVTVITAEGKQHAVTVRRNPAQKDNGKINSKHLS
ncbi:uncharacterized protein LOC111820964 isoform X2 [Trichechus manatus latirostris]|uniref:Uncharacterized protein LOC111820964 isoform X2 n=1 Tax=Trichechus manatus latirostris TaxID=127582 RepID=A0A2Y9R6B4_TRIMA|nr:uncharacterized protein LOC111820964 isoform X2 [Trichechus manatus latirostris]